MSELVFELDGVSKTYAERQVLEVEHLQIFGGEILSIIGPSGAGKSTLLRLLNFLEAPDEGCIRFQGQVYETPAAVPLHVRRRITTVFQRPLLLNRSVRANVRYGLWLRGRRGGNEQVDAVLEDVGLRAAAAQPSRTLSGGEAQRVALARAVVVNPAALLLDEPTANLDPYNVGVIETIVRRQSKEAGTTVVLVTHNVFQARRLADRVLFLYEGKVVEANKTEALFKSPADPRTAAFINGDMVY